mgnify:CR=1 FL=1
MFIRSICVLILLLPGLFTAVANAEIYRYVDDNGRVVYSSEKPVENASASKVTIRDNTVSSMTSYTESEGREVVLYSASWCGVCKQARAYFEDQSIDYDEYDIENDPRGKRDYARFGGRGVPIILVVDQRMYVFRQARFDQLYSVNN